MALNPTCREVLQEKKKKEEEEVLQGKDTEANSEECSQEPEQLNTSQVLQVEYYEQIVNEKRQRRLQKKCDSQALYNEEMTKQCKSKAEKKCSKFKVGDLVLTKLMKLDKAAPFRLNLLLGKIREIENNYARAVTKFRKIHSLLSPTRLMKRTATNLQFDYSKEISSTMACKQANLQNKMIYFQFDVINFVKQGTVINEVKML